MPEDESIDNHIDLSKCVHVVDADSSQATVIEETRGGRNLVVQGPPGTGKSQTITNIIAGAAHGGKTVLFVAEKTAALEVVYDRLVKAGLAALCLEMHSRKANKREVLKSLEQALRLSGTSPIDVDVPTKLAASRDKLNLWSSAIHRPIGKTARTVFDIIGRQVKLRSDGTRLLDCRLDDAAAWSAAKLSSVEVVVDRAGEAVAKLSGHPKDHPWFGTNINSQSPFDLDRLIPTLNSALEKLATLSAELKGVFALIADNRDPSIADAFATVKAFRHVAAVPKESRAVLGNQAWVRDLAALEGAIEAGQRFAKSISKVEGHFEGGAWTCDTESLLIALRADGVTFFRRLRSRYRKANAEVRAISRGTPPKALQARIALLETLKKAQEDRREFDTKVPLLSAALGGAWAEQKTPWPDFRILAAWTRCALSELGGARLLTLAARAQDLRVFNAFAVKLEAAIMPRDQHLTNSKS